VRQDDNTLIQEARDYAAGIYTLFSNMPDGPVEALEPSAMMLMLNPIIDRLDQALQGVASPVRLTGTE